LLAEGFICPPWFSSPKEVELQAGRFFQQMIIGEKFASFKNFDYASSEIDINATRCSTIS
jgi:hypothetical protein